MKTRTIFSAVWEFVSNNPGARLTAIAAAVGKHPNAVANYMTKLHKQGAVRREQRTEINDSNAYKHNYFVYWAVPGMQPNAHRGRPVVRRNHKRRTNKPHMEKAVPALVKPMPSFDASEEVRAILDKMTLGQLREARNFLNYLLPA